MRQRYKVLYTPPRTLFIPVGTPLMGKTTWIKKALPKTIASVSRDDIRKAISRPVSLGIGKFYETIVDEHMEDEIEKLWWYALEWNMKRGVPLVSDTTNLTYRGRHRLCQLAQQHRYVPIVVVFATRDMLRECINKDSETLINRAKELYRWATKLKDKDQYLLLIKELGISSSLGITLMMRNYERLHRDNIFINTRVLSAMLKRMYRDYPHRAYLKTDFYKVKVIDTGKPCLDRCRHIKKYRATAKPPIKPTMEGKEW